VTENTCAPVGRPSDPLDRSATRVVPTEDGLRVRAVIDETGTRGSERFVAALTGSDRGGWVLGLLGDD